MNQLSSHSAATHSYPANARNHHDNRGAVSLRDSLLQYERHLSRERLSHEVDFWMDSIKGKEKADPAALNVSKWYWNEVGSRSYQAPNWRITPERSALFHQFRSDPYYHLKNLVEIVSRTLVDDLLKSSGLDVEVMITSDSDDVFSGVDFIVEVRNPGGSKDYVGFDLAISDNPDYLDRKGQRSRTICREFNQFMGWKKSPEGRDREMVREVFAIPPKVMASFLPAFMKRVASGNAPSSQEILELFEAAKLNNVKNTIARTQARTNELLH